MQGINCYSKYVVICLASLAGGLDNTFLTWITRELRGIKCYKSNCLVESCLFQNKRSDDTTADQNPKYKIGLN